MVDIFLCLAQQNFLLSGETVVQEAKLTCVWSLDGGELPDKLQVLPNVAGELWGMFLWMALNQNGVCGGKGSRSGAGTRLSTGWCWHLGNPENLPVGGPSHLVMLKLMTQVVLGTGCIFNLALVHSEWRTRLALILFSTCLRVEWLCAVCERWLIALGNPSWHVKWMLSIEGCFTIWSNYWQRLGYISCFTGNLGLHNRNSSISNSDSGCSNLIYSIIRQRDQKITFKDNISALCETAKRREAVLFIWKGLVTSACPAGRTALESHEPKTPCDG